MLKFGIKEINEEKHLAQNYLNLWKLKLDLVYN